MDNPNLEDLKIFQEEPVDFIELAFGDILWSKQKDICNSVRDNKYTSVKSCFDSGKSFIASRIAQWFLYSFPNSKVVTTAPTFKQVKDILWRELRASNRKAKVNLGGQLNDTSLDLSPDWFAVGMSTNDPSNFTGIHAVYVLVIIDEAAGVEEDIFNAAEGLISSQQARILYIGNPTNIEGTFFRSFKLPSYSKISISAFDTPNFTAYGITIDDIRNNTWKEKITGDLPAPYLVTPDWVYDKFIRWGETSPMFQALILGVFPEQGESTLIPLHKIEAAYTLNLEIQEDDPEVTGVDIARFGSDKSEFAYRKGSKVLDWRTVTNSDTVQTSGTLRQFLGLHPRSGARIDDIGVGAGVLDNVKTAEEFKDIQGVNVGMPSNEPEMFYNLRAEIYWNLRERFINGEIDLSGLPKEVFEDLSAQLSNINFEYTIKGQIKIESKEEMKKRGLPSPDKADALALAFGNVSKRPGIIDFMKGFAS